MIRVLWAEEALADVYRHASYIAQFNPRAVAAMTRQVFEAGRTLASFPHRGRQGRVSGTREMVAVHPYAVVYTIERDLVTILRVWHGAQNRAE